MNGVELRVFVGELLKGNPRNIEFLFVPRDRTIRRGGAWCELVAMRERFITNRAVKQYFG